MPIQELRMTADWRTVPEGVEDPDGEGRGSVSLLVYRSPAAAPSGHPVRRALRRVQWAVGCLLAASALALVVHAVR